jgi:hypothetical protein
MNFQLLKNEVRELTLQELSHNGVMIEEQFDDLFHDILHNELDREVSYLSLKEIEEVIIDFGLNEALYIAMSNTGLSVCPAYGENIYSPSILYQAILDNISITWDDYKEWMDEQDEEDEEEEKEKTNCDDCKEPFKTVGSLTIRMMFEDKFLCKDCCVKRCDEIVVPEGIVC